jgi:hypothetical protein
MHASLEDLGGARVHLARVLSSVSLVADGRSIALVVVDHGGHKKP